MTGSQSRRIMLGELLVRAGVITEAQLKTALVEQKKWGGKLGHLLVELNFLNEDTLVKALAKQLGLPRVDFDQIEIQQDALQKLDAGYAQQHQVLPIALDAVRKHLVVAMADPGNIRLVDELGFRTGCKIRVAIAGEKVLEKTIRDSYHGEGFLPADAVELEEDQLKFVDHQNKTVIREMKELLSAADQSGNLEPAMDPSMIQTGPEASRDLDQRLARIEAVVTRLSSQVERLVEVMVAKGMLSLDDIRQIAGT